ncbi:g12451 [Coccomyxa viridis]|uniref:G12451 protein n=1 Tax=Coccomyxa viridis TaxID=1274662 RepID=A0ABP1GAD3_9CHLO
MGAAPFPAVIATRLAGNWRKDKSNSDVDCYARQLDLLQIQGIQKACALKLINGLQIESDQERLKVVYKVDNVPFYKHTEEFKLGQSVSMSRRDKKSGQQHAAMRALPKGVEVDIQLDPPYSGSIREVYNLYTDDTLSVTSVTTVKGQTEKCIQVYRRQ